MHDPTRQPELVLTFLQSTLPFSELEARVQDGLARACSVDFIPAGTRLFARGQTRPDRLWLVQKGAVRLTGASGPPASAHSEDMSAVHASFVAEEILEDVRGEGASLGAVALIDGGVTAVDADTVEDTFFITMPGTVFRQLVADEQVVAQYYLKGLPERFLSKAFAEMRVRCEGLADERALYLFASRVGDLVSRPPLSVLRGTSLRQAAAVMVEQGIGCLLVRESGRGGPDAVPEAERDIMGIVTDSDLRKAVAMRMDYEAPVETLMSTPVISVEADRPCFDGLLEMMRRQMHHLAVVRQGRIVGVVTAHDIMVMQGRTPMSLFREIMHQRSLEGLYPLGRKVPQVVRGLVEEGARAGAITRMITVFNDLMLEKVLSLLQREIGPAPVPFTWLCMGSEGRREQTFVTDQDNALVIRDTEDPVIRRAAEVYFTAFTERAVQHLARCGYQLCQGGMMADSARWRMNQTGWSERFATWIRRPAPEEVLEASIFFDFRAGYGRSDFAQTLRDQVLVEAGANELFQRHLAADALRQRPPLSIFRNLIVEKDGRHRNSLDLKARGCVPFVDFARVMALRCGIRETNTLERLAALEQGDHIPARLGIEAREAYEFVMHLRLVRQLERLEQGYTPDNHTAPARLSQLEKQALKEAFSVAVRLQSFLREVFHLGM